MSPTSTTTTTVVEAVQAVGGCTTDWSGPAVAIVVAILGLAGVVWKAIGDRRSSAEIERRTAAEELFTSALDSVHEYQELPYRIRRRSDVPPTTPSELTAHVSDVQVLIDKHVTRLTFFNADVGDAYRALAGEVRRESGSHMNKAWTQPRITTDKDMNLGNAYPRTQAEGAREHCITVMQQFLDAPATRRRFRRGRR